MRIFTESEREHGRHWSRIMPEEGGWEVVHDAADNIPVNGTEVLLVKMFQRQQGASGDLLWDDQPGPDTSQPELILRMREVVTATVALVLVKTDVPEVGDAAGTIKYRRIGIMFFDRGPEFVTEDIVVIK